MPQAKFVPEMKVREDINLLGVPVLDRSWAKVSDGPRAVFTGAERLSGSFSRQVQGMRDMGLDIVFIFDATSSMAGFLRQVKFKIANLVTTFKALVPTARVGLVAYRDTGDDFVTKTQQLTYSTQSLQDFLRDIAPVGGGDREEAVGRGPARGRGAVQLEEEVKKNNSHHRRCSPACAGHARSQSPCRKV